MKYLSVFLVVLVLMIGAVHGAKPWLDVDASVVEYTGQDGGPVQPTGTGDGDGEIIVNPTATCPYTVSNDSFIVIPKHTEADI